jgi:hypothetical protein
MRRRIRMILLAALVVALAVPFGTALTLERRPSAPAPIAVTVQTPTADASAPIPSHPLAEAGLLMLTGCLLIALGAAVRRSS